MYAAELSISCEINGANLIVTYTGTLYQSSDAVNWTEVTFASSPYQTAIGGKSLFFCVRGESESKNITIPLSDTVDLEMIWIEEARSRWAALKTNWADTAMRHSIR